MRKPRVILFDVYFLTTQHFVTTQSCVSKCVGYENRCPNHDFGFFVLMTLFVKTEPQKLKRLLPLCHLFDTTSSVFEICLSHWPTENVVVVLKGVFSKHMLIIDQVEEFFSWNRSHQLWMTHSTHLIETWTLFRAMDWCRQATNHYLRQCWPSFMSPHGASKPQIVDVVSWLLSK